MKNFQDLVDWVIRNTEHDTTPKAEEAVCWFVAIQEATMIHESNTIKDTARMLLDGCSKISGAYVTEWLECLLELSDECSEPNKPCLEGLIRSLCAHFKVEKGTE